VFTPIANKARWAKIYDEIRPYEVDDVLTYDKLLEICEVEDIHTVRVDVYRAIKELEVERQRTMENVRGVGYRVVRANEHERLVRKDVRKIHRTSRRAHSRTVNVRRSELTPDERRRIDDLQLKLSQHEEMLGRISRRVDRHETLIEAARRETQAARRESKETMAELYERLGKVESRVNGNDS
jgi:hypothetical protein